MYVISNYLVKTEMKCDKTFTAVNSAGWNIPVCNLVFVLDCTLKLPNKIEIKIVSSGQHFSCQPVCYLKLV